MGRVESGHRVTCYRVGSGDGSRVSLFDPVPALIYNNTAQLLIDYFRPFVGCPCSSVFILILFVDFCLFSCGRLCQLAASFEAAHANCPANYRIVSCRTRPVFRRGTSLVKHYRGRRWVTTQPSR